MPKLEEIDEPDDIEDLEHSFRRRKITIEERDAILRKIRTKYPLEASDTEFKMLKGEIQEYGDTEEKLERLSDDNIDDVPIKAESIEEVESSFTKSSTLVELEKPKLEIVITRPEVHGITIGSIIQLRELIINEFPSLVEMEKFEIIIKDAENHLGLFHKYEGTDFLYHGEIRQIASELQVREGAIRKWMRKGKTPKIYELVNSKK